MEVFTWSNGSNVGIQSQSSLSFPEKIFSFIQSMKTRLACNRVSLKRSTVEYKESIDVWMNMSSYLHAFGNMGINFIFATGTCKHKHKQQQTKKCTKLLTVAASTSMAVTLRLAVKGILRDFISFCHFDINISRNSWLKGPEYDKKPVHNKTSPTNLREQKQTNIGFITLLAT